VARLPTPFKEMPTVSEYKIDRGLPNLTSPKYILVTFVVNQVK